MGGGRVIRTQVVFVNKHTHLMGWRVKKGELWEETVKVKNDL